MTFFYAKCTNKKSPLKISFSVVQCI